MTELWVLQAKSDDPRDYWVNISVPQLFDEIKRYVEQDGLPSYRSRGIQHYYRAYCTTNDQLDYVSWQSLTDFPDFEGWIEEGEIAQTKDGTVWKLQA